MKRLIAWVLVLAMCVSAFAGCTPVDDSPSSTPTTEPVGTTAPVADEAALENAIAYVRMAYKDAAETTPADFQRIGTVPVGNVKYQVVWSVDVSEDLVKIIVGENGMVTIDINEETPEDVPYVLTATITDAAGNTRSLSWNHVIPAALNADETEIVDMAYALEPGESLPNVATLTGVITSIDTPWDDGYKNITVTIAVAGREDKPIQCYRLAGEGAQDLAMGDTITVTGTLKNYNGTIEFDAGCTLDAVVKGEGVTAVAPEDPKQIVDEAYALASGMSLPYEATLTGEIISVDSAWSDQYSNITVTIKVAGREGKPIQCYRLSGSGASGLKVTDTITVKGYIKNYNGTIEFTQGCTLLAVEKGAGIQAPSDPKQIVDAAYALGGGESLPYTATLIGVITQVNYSYSEAYGDISVTIAVSGRESKPIYCYCMTGSGIDKIGVGDTIQVRGMIKNYVDANGVSKIEFDRPTLVSYTKKPAVQAPSDPKQIVDEAYALEQGATLPYKATLTGKIISVDTPWSDQYSNITVSIAVEGRESKPIQCFRLKGNGAQDLAVGDTITVTGDLMNYSGTIEFNSGCTLDEVVKGGQDVPVAPSDPTEIVDAAYALEQGESLPYNATLTGKIVSVDTPWDEGYGNITVSLVVEGREDKPIMCYRLKGDGADTLAVGDTITVTGSIKNYSGTIEFVSGCTLDAVVKGEGGEEKPENPDVPVEPDDPIVTEAPFANGDKVVIYAPAYNKALSTEKVSETSYYNAGVDVTVTDGIMSGYGETEIWTVIKNEDGTYSYANGEQNIGLAEQYSSMNLGAVHDDWALEAVENGTYLLKNVGRGNYMQWADNYGNWSTYNPADAAADDQYQLSFCIVEKAETPEEPEEPVIPTDPVEIVNAAYALGSGESLPYSATLTGEIISIDSPWSDQYGNITVTIAVEGAEDKPIQCYRLKGEGADTLAVGDTITVTGTLMNYSGTVEFTSGCSLDAVVKGEEEPDDPDVPVEPETPAVYKFYVEQVNLGKKLYFNGELSGEYLATTEDVNEAVDVYMEETEDGVRFYYLDGEIKTYIQIYKNDAGKIRPQLSAEATMVYTYSEEAQTYVADIEGTDYYLGTYGTYNTFSASKTSYITGDNAANVGVSQFVAAFEEVQIEDEEPETSAAYKFYVEQVNLGKKLYFNGELSGEYLATTEDVNEAVDVYMEETEDGVRFYYLNGETKTYIQIYKNDAGKIRPQLSAEATMVYTYSEEAQTYVADIEGTDYYLGTYGTYNTFSASKTSYITGDNAANVGVSQFVGAFEEVVTEEEPENPEVPEEPETATAYKFYLEQVNLGKKLYFNGAMSGEYLATTEDVNEAVDVYKEETEEGIRFYYLGGETKTYIQIYKNDAGKIRPQLSAEATMVYTYSEEAQTYVADIEGTDYYLGTYGTYNTFSASKTSYITGDNAANVGVSQFVGVFEEVVTEEEPENPDVPEEPVVPTDPVEIVNAAYALESGESLSYSVTLTGVITSIDTPYNDGFGNITVTIQIGDLAEQPIQCYRLAGEGVSALAVGDTITVTGTISNYNGKVQYSAGATCDAIVKGENDVPVSPEDPKLIVDAAFALESGKALPYNATLTGVIVSIDSEYSEQFGNITVTISVSGSDGEKALMCYRMKGEGAADLVVGDTITVTGSIKNYNGTIEFDSGCTFVR